MFILYSNVILLTISIIYFVQSTIVYHNDFEPRVFDYIPLNCYDCLSYRDIILTQLTDVPARSFVNFNLGSRDTYMILNGQLNLRLHPYAFQSMIVQKPNKTLTITLTAPNSWLNITENTFNGLELRSYSTLRIVIKFFYGCTFHTNSLSGIKMDEQSKLIIDISSLTEVTFENNVINENDFNSSVQFLISRSDTVRFDSYSFYQLNINSNQMISFHFELISHVHFKSYSFKSLRLQTLGSFRFYSIFLNRLTIDSYAFDNMLLDSHSIFNFTIHTLGTCLCLRSYSFNSLSAKYHSENVVILFQFYSLRSLSLFSNTFFNLSLDNSNNQLQISSINSLNDPNPIVNFAMDAFTTVNNGTIVLNFSQVILVRFEKHSLKTNYLSHRIFLKDISFVDLSALNDKLIKRQFHLFFDDIEHVQWYKQINEEKSVQNYQHHSSLVQYHFNYISNSSCLIYSASRTIPWFFSMSNLTICNCPLLYAHKHDQIGQQFVPCLSSMSRHEIMKRMNECSFEKLENHCHSTIQSLTDFNSTYENLSKIFHSFELNNILIQKLYDRSYLSCSFNYSFLSTTSVVRTRLLNNLGIVIGSILAIFIILLIIVITLLNGLQYKMREYDEAWTWKRNMSWTTIRRTISQTSLRRSRRDLCTLNGHGVISKSDNQLDRLNYEHEDENTEAIENDGLKVSRSIHEKLRQI